MTFLNPVYLFGLIAAGVPIVIHFLNLRRLQEVKFSSLKFLKEIQRTKIRNIKIKQWLLLLIRVLIIIFVVLAFARPTIKNDLFVSDQSQAKTSAVIIIDNSISMSVKSNSQTNLSAAKDAAKEYLKLLKNGDEVSVITTSQNIVKKRIKNFRVAAKEINQIEPVYVSKDLSVSVRTAVEELNQASNLNKEIIIFSDFQKSRTFAEGKVSYKYIIDNKIKFFIVNYRKEEINNISLIKLELSNQLLEKESNITYTGNLSNSSNLNNSENIISLFINKERVAQSSFGLEAKQNINLNLQSKLKRAGLIEAFAEIEDDDILYDNRIYHTVYMPENIDVIGVAEDLEELKNISIVLNQVANVNFRIVSVNQIPSVKFNSESLIIISIPNSEEKIKQLKNILPPNKNILIIPGVDLSENILNIFLREFNIGSAKYTESTSPMEFENVDLSHPVFLDLFEEEKTGKIESPGVIKSFRLKISEPFRQIISLQNNSDFLAEKVIDARRFMIFSLPFDAGYSDFQMKGLFAPLVIKIVYYLAANLNNQANKFAGDIISFDLNDEFARDFKVVRPDESTEFFRSDNKIVKYKKTDIIGAYKFYVDDELIHFEDININPWECNYKFYKSEEVLTKLDFVGISNNKYVIDSPKELNNIIRRSRVGAELWKIMIVISIILILVEMLLAKNSKKQIAEAFND